MLVSGKVLLKGSRLISPFQMVYLNLTSQKGLFDKRPYSYPIGSMYGIFTCIWFIFTVDVGKYTIHGWYGFPKGKPTETPPMSTGKPQGPGLFRRMP